MPPTQFSMTVLTDDVADVAAFYVEHFDFEVRLDIGWFVTLHHGERPYELGILALDSPTIPEPHAGRAAGGILGMLVDDVDEYDRRLQASGATIVQPVRDEPWGQRHLYVTDPAGTLIDVVQQIPPDPQWLAAAGLLD